MPDNRSGCIAIYHASMFFRTKCPDANRAPACEDHCRYRKPSKNFWPEWHSYYPEVAVDCVQKRFKAPAGQSGFYNFIDESSDIENIFYMLVGVSHCCIVLWFGALRREYPCFLWLEDLQGAKCKTGLTPQSE